MKFLFFVVGVFGGILYVIYHRKITEMINIPIGWAEKYLGPAGTYTAHLLFGLLAIILGFLLGFGVIDFGV
ncbi:TPA: hypothetical protein DCR79_02135 [Patescibacteria group bacterium]|nr:hypothetical protein [Patescibacteria group bacterium]HCR42272.1 hypothetical protein [Patescibacteria group bacterium]